jgi:hypothetical protein
VVLVLHPVSNAQRTFAQWHHVFISYATRFILPLQYRRHLFTRSIIQYIHISILLRLLTAFASPHHRECHTKPTQPLRLIVERPSSISMAIPRLGSLKQRKNSGDLLSNCFALVHLAMFCHVCAETMPENSMLLPGSIKVIRHHVFDEPVQTFLGVNDPDSLSLHKALVSHAELAQFLSCPLYLLTYPATRTAAASTCRHLRQQSASNNLRLHRLAAGRRHRTRLRDRVQGCSGAPQVALHIHHHPLRARGECQEAAQRVHGRGFVRVEEDRESGAAL